LNTSFSFPFSAFARFIGVKPARALILSTLPSPNSGKSACKVLAVSTSIPGTEFKISFLVIYQWNFVFTHYSVPPRPEKTIEASLTQRVGLHNHHQQFRPESAG
jgi:hypothetical protein